MAENNSINILIVDDHQIVRDGIKSLLEDQKDINICGEAADGEGLIKLLAGKKVDVILMDISLPGKSGIELTAEIVESFPGMSVLMLSMYIEEEVILKAVKNGAKGYLQKNTTKSELISAIHAMASGDEYFSDQVNGILAQHTIQKTRKEEAKGLEDVSKREMEILGLLSAGLSNQEIGEKLFISVRTVESHKTHIMQKLGLKTNIELYRFLVRQGFLKL